MKKKDEESQPRPGSGFSRRSFLRGVGVSSALSTAILGEAQAEPQAPPALVGPGPVDITLQINGKSVKVTAEPRETLLDVLRNRLDLTAAKRVCDRGTCGACTVILNGKVVYACTVLAIDAQGKPIQTLEGIAQGPNPHPIVQAFVNHDAQQCGYCTPGFVVAAKGFLDRHPNPKLEDLRKGLGGNLCRCGTYMGVRAAVLEAAKARGGGRNA
jgi:xanthine dehydrogenase YagT iron-sulfur-binding subunit